MDKWNELRTAYMLAKLGTLSAAADEIGVHRSTVMRHIDMLEEHLGIVLFQRNDKGYIPTEAGLEVMRLGEVTNNHFSQLSTRLKSDAEILEGRLRVTVASELASLIMPTIREYQRLYPGMHVEIIGDLRKFKLEYGEADIAIRVGEKPTTPDNVVFPLTQIEVALMAHEMYLSECWGQPERPISSQRFIALNQRPKHLIWNEWIFQNIDEKNIIAECSSQHIVTLATLNALGIGALPKQLLGSYPQLCQIPVEHDWRIPIWALVHRDMVSAPKVKVFVNILKGQHWDLDLFC